MLFKVVDTPLRTTLYHTTLKPFIGDECGQGVLVALFDQYGGKSQWETVFETMEQKLKARKWKSIGIIPLTNHAAYHHEMHTSMTRMAKQI